ncbi:SurA N-terminal domain-containing protein [Dinoroseobacter sp. PD6]|uniref:peptidylprolyl isomerase n=1 Tax=Dinoroseobacter sp. PD6 TaxID=3028384 RepID=UPI00237B303D|nr:peptidylprolyl isomerase [Dinoroseobacter sp. PD6]MDD9715363.1 SurA N-terminal domain-containing protein [Dinoroseobacter sp. PD6]
MKGKTSNFFMFILLGLLIVALAGFGISSFGGSNARVGSVGDTDITVDEYARALQTQLRAAGQQRGRAVSMAEARELGLDRQVLAQLVNTAAIDNEAAKLGVSVGDMRVAEQIQTIPAFSGIGGGFDREAYEFTLQQNNLSPEEFEADVRNEAARNLLQAAVIGGLRAPQAYTGTLYDFIAARRDFTWAEITPDLVALTQAMPTDAELRAFYDANPAAFTAPETREITYVLLSPEMMQDQVSPSEEDLRAAYDRAASVYVQPERRLLDRVVFGTEAQAAEAKAALDSGAQSFEELLAARDLSLEDVDLGEVARDDLDDAVAEVVFGDQETGIVGPVRTALGPALFRINAALAAQVTTFEEARDELTAALAGDAARRAVADEIEALDDLLAGGATLEELAADTPAELGELSLTATTTEGIAAYPEVRALANTLSEGDFPEIETLDDGGVFALRLDEVVPPRLLPFDEVREDVVAGWEAQRLQDALSAEAARVAEALRGGESFADQGLDRQVETGLTREAFIEGTPPALVTDVFALEAEGDVALVPGNGVVIVAQLTAILPPDTEDPDAAFLRNVLDQSVSQTLAEDVFTAYATAIQQEAGITINQSAINGIHAQFP